MVSTYKKIFVAVLLSMAIPFAIYPQADTTRVKVQPTIAPDYETLMGEKSALDLVTPSNIKTEAELDSETGNYIIRTKIGEKEIGTPITMPNTPYNPPNNVMAKITQKPANPVDSPNIFGPMMFPSTCCKTRTNISRYSP